MALRVIIPERDFARGEVFESAAFAANRLDRFARIVVHRLGWPDMGASSAVIRVSLLYSPDSGQKWQERGGFTSAGGTIILRGGQTLDYCVMTPGAFKEVDNDRRQIKVLIEALRPLRTRVEFDTAETPIRQVQALAFGAGETMVFEGVAAALASDATNPLSPGFDPNYTMSLLQIATDEADIAELEKRIGIYTSMRGGPT